MPIRARRIKETDTTILEHTCEDCGIPAYFGKDVQLRKAFIAADKGQLELAKKLLGKWYCYEHWKEAKKNNPGATEGAGGDLFAWAADKKP